MHTISTISDSDLPFCWLTAQNISTDCWEGEITITRNQHTHHRWFSPFESLRASLALPYRIDHRCDRTTVHALDRTREWTSSSCRLSSYFFHHFRLLFQPPFGVCVRVAVAFVCVFPEPAFETLNKCPKERQTSICQAARLRRALTTAEQREKKQGRTAVKRRRISCDNESKCTLIQMCVCVCACVCIHHTIMTLSVQQKHWLPRNQSMLSTRFACDSTLLHTQSLLGRRIVAFLWNNLFICFGFSLALFSSTPHRIGLSSSRMPWRDLWKMKKKQGAILFDLERQSLPALITDGPLFRKRKDIGKVSKVIDAKETGRERERKKRERMRNDCP